MFPGPKLPLSMLQEPSPCLQKLYKRPWSSAVPSGLNGVEAVSFQKSQVQSTGQCLAFFPSGPLPLTLLPSYSIASSQARIPLQNASVFLHFTLLP